MSTIDELVQLCVCVCACCACSAALLQRCMPPLLGLAPESGVTVLTHQGAAVPYLARQEAAAAVVADATSHIHGQSSALTTGVGAQEVGADAGINTTATVLYEALPSSPPAMVEGDPVVVFYSGNTTATHPLPPLTCPINHTLVETLVHKIQAGNTAPLSNGGRLGEGAAADGMGNTFSSKWCGHVRAAHCDER